MIGAKKCPGLRVSTETRAGCSVGWRTGEGTHGKAAGPELASERITHPHVCVAVPVWQRGFAVSEQQSYCLKANYFFCASRM